MKTRIYKSMNGWQGLTLTEADGKGEAWQISTSKGRNGVECTAIKGRASNGMFSYDMFGAKRLKLAAEAGQCTEKKVTTVHAAGVAEFIRQMGENTELSKPAYIIEVGQIFFTDFINGGKDNRRAVYEITSPGNYKTVTLDGKQLTRDDHVRPYTEKFGIGVYYNEGEKISPAQVAELVEQAREYQAHKAAEAEKAAERAVKVRAEKLERGRQLLPALPENLAAIITAELRQDESDLHSDYHGYSTKEVVYLAYSLHKRDLFPELRKAAAKYENTQHFATPEQKPEDAGDYWHPSDEHREKYSMGSGYYLGNKYSGWVVQKSGFANTPEYLETLQIAAAEGRFFCEPSDLDKLQSAEAANLAPVEPEPGKIQVIEYGAGLAVVGDTRPIKDKLKALGGRFNFRLTCGAGWVFPKSKLAELQKALAA